MLKPRFKFLLIPLFSCLLAACGDPIGSPCKISGSGFHASHNCQHRCLQYRQITCPDGQTINPHICSGNERCQPGSCPDGQACYTIEDAFNNESYCLPDNVCGTQTEAILKQWEHDSLNTAQALRDAYQKKKAQRTGLTAPTEHTP